MAGPFYVRLNRYYNEVASVLRGEANAASIFPNSTDIGTSRERVYVEFLREHLPPNCRAMMGGFLFAIDGAESGQIDVIVTSDVVPRYEFFSKNDSGKSFSCIDGTVAVVSVKSNLNTNELHDALSNLASLPDKEPLGNRVMPTFKLNGYDDWPFKIIYASSGVSLDTLMKGIETFYNSRPDIPVNKRPNIIHVAGKHVVQRIGEQGGVTRDGTRISPFAFHAMPGSNCDAYALTYVVTEIQKIALATRYILFDYGPIINHLPLC
jgi:hypothetical protein